ncbi:uncharacterized protein LOC129601156 [Paramacrobiotus metropolitanus]|uniref:uncharacterized protein LOC129601156 n=1 Tax=Paramacrobiotus metropolitanus TaxID=2943436 RepID=UPI00244593DD|nr:uncharacterized protein LOC129601156 [Paramacrobiotus metropolitanus]XP_055355865.1 uncharacterized protein LOC129601156 [Paramacrobiotus metropolitanus]
MERFGYLCLAVLFAAVPSVLSRKCYVCDSQQNPSCADGYQTGSMSYQDCSTYGSGGFGQFGQQGGQFGQGGQAGQFGQGGQFPQQQFGYGDMNRCFKLTRVNPAGGPAIITRGCGSGMQMQGPSYGATSDGCVWNGLQQSCSCDSNYCNGSARFTPTRFTALLIGLLSVCAGVLYRHSL